jgi:hypothetical protein
MDSELMSDVYRKINTNEYKTKLHFVPSRENAKLYAEYMEDNTRLEQLFKQDAIEAVGLTNNPKANSAYKLAWDYGHSSGYSEVFNYLIDLAELVLS